ncbi:MAG: HDIG domain-containing metalloprotein [bacterium]
MKKDVKTKCGISREEALELMQHYLPQDNLRKHCLATEAIMRMVAKKLGFDEDVWAIAGLLHDLDYVDTKDKMEHHGLITEKILREKGVSDEITEAIKGHNADNLGFKRKDIFEHALTCSECITGMIVATTLVYPDKKIASVKPKSITKRMRQKEFARSVNRDYIRECEKIGIPLNDFALLSLEAMREISEELGL